MRRFPIRRRWQHDPVVIVLRAIWQRSGVTYNTLAKKMQAILKTETRVEVKKMARVNEGAIRHIVSGERHIPHEIGERTVWLEAFLTATQANTEEWNMVVSLLAREYTRWLVMLYRAAPPGEEKTER